MNKQQFKQKLKDLGINQRIIASDLDISFQQVTNWNKDNKYPAYVNLYFDNINNKKELKILRDKISNLIK
jgi:hypothetical protein